MLAVDVMTTEVISVAEDATVPAVARLLAERGISAVPVVDDEGRLAGIVSEGDLIRRPELGTERRRSWWLAFIGDRSQLAEAYIKSHGLVARDVMTAEVVSVDEGTPVAAIAELLEQRRIKRVPVMRGGMVVGIVSRANLVQALASLTSMEAGAANDGAIRDALLDALGREAWVRPGRINVTVHEHVAHIWGSVNSVQEYDALTVLARRTPGVREVRNRVAVMPPEVPMGL